MRMHRAKDKMAAIIDFIDASEMQSVQSFVFTAKHLSLNLLFQELKTSLNQFWI